MDRKMRKSKRSFYAVFNPKTDLGKSRNNFRLVGFEVEKTPVLLLTFLGFWGLYHAYSV